MNMRKILAIFTKQVKDTFKNKSVFVQFVMFPILAIIMQNSIKIDGMQENFFVTLFATMYIAMAPITSMAAIISEEKEKNTLRVLLMSNVKPTEYLLGVGSYVFIICMMGSFVFLNLGNYNGHEIFQFIATMAIGILISIIIGSAVGTWSKNQMVATSIIVPIIMVFSFLPMLSSFNETIRKISVFAYSQQIQILINEIGNIHLKPTNVIVLVSNIIFTFVLFVFAYRKSNLA